MKISFIGWVRYQRRNELIAQKLGASVHWITLGGRSVRWQTPLRYAVHTAQTWRVLQREHPDLIIVQNPPIFCVGVAYFYSRLHGAQYVIDSHTGAFVPPWSWSRGLHRWLAQRARVTLLHNRDQLADVRGWRGLFFVLEDNPELAHANGDYPLSRQFNIAVISSFAPDEPLDAVFDAARILDDVDFYLTGDAGRAGARWLEKMPHNVHPTGYLPYEQYASLLYSTDAVLALTTRDHTLLCGAHEATAVGTPLIVSDWRILCERFPRGTVHTPNTVSGICEGVRRVQREQAALRRDMLTLRTELQADWASKFTKLEHILRDAE